MLYVLQWKKKCAILKADFFFLTFTTILLWAAFFFSCCYQILEWKQHHFSWAIDPFNFSKFPDAIRNISNYLVSVVHLYRMRIAHCVQCAPYIQFRNKEWKAQPFLQHFMSQNQQTIHFNGWTFVHYFSSLSPSKVILNAFQQLILFAFKWHEHFVVVFNCAAFFQFIEFICYT